MLSFPHSDSARLQETGSLGLPHHQSALTCSALTSSQVSGTLHLRIPLEPLIWLWVLEGTISR